MQAPWWDLRTPDSGLGLRTTEPQRAPWQEIIWLFREAMAETEREVALQGVKPGIRKGHTKYLLSPSPVAPGLQPWTVKPWAMGDSGKCMYFGLIEVVGILATLARGPRQVHLQFLSSSTQRVVVVGCRVDAEVKLDRGWGGGGEMFDRVPDGP